MADAPTPETTRPPLQPWQLLVLLVVWVAMVAVCFGVPVVALLLAGDALDWHYDTAPKGLLGGAAAGLLVGTGCTLLAGRWLWMRLGLHRMPPHAPADANSWHYNTPGDHDAPTEPKKSKGDEADATNDAAPTDKKARGDDKSDDSKDGNDDAGGDSGDGDSSAD